MTLVTDVSYPCIAISVDTPDGKMFVVFFEDFKDTLVAIQIHIGKTGTSLAAWTNGVGILINSLLEHGATVDKILIALSNITTHKTVYTNSQIIPIRSGIDGLVYAIMKYNETKAYYDPRAQRPIFTNDIER